jgi:hypothetical protein
MRNNAGNAIDGVGQPPVKAVEAREAVNDGSQVSEGRTPPRAPLETSISFRKRLSETGRIAREV